MWILKAPGEVALAWALYNPAITAAIVGLRKAEQVHGTVGAMDFRLSAGEAGKLEEFLKAGQRLPGRRGQPLTRFLPCFDNFVIVELPNRSGNGRKETNRRTGCAVRGYVFGAGH